MPEDETTDLNPHLVQQQAARASASHAGSNLEGMFAAISAQVTSAAQRLMTPAEPVPAPCPHCGGSQIVVREIAAPVPLQCRDCGAAIIPGSDITTRSALIAAWNRRS